VKYFSSPEANLLFSLSVLAEKIIKKAQKRFDDKDISAESFKELHNEMFNAISNANTRIEIIGKQYIAKKSYLSQTAKRRKNA
jgi:vacuolar-type H+-ATPase subunit B/Vma2